MSEKKLNLLFGITIGADFLFLHSILSQVTFVLFVLFFVGCYKKPTNPQYFFRSYLIFAIWSVVVIYTGHAEDRSIAMTMTTTLFLNAVFLYALGIYADVNHDFLKMLHTYRNVAIVCCIIILIFGLSGALSGNRLDDVMGQNSNVIGRLGAYASIYQIYCIRKAHHATKYDIGTLALFFLVILFSGSRTALVIPIIATIILYCASNPRMLLLYIPLFALASYVLLQLVLHVDFLYDMVGYRIAPLLVQSGADIDEGSYLTRAAFVELGWEESKNSLVYGHGIDCFRTLRYAYGTYSHSNYIEILYGTGWVGIIIYYFSFVLALLKVPKALKVNTEMTALSLSILVPYLLCEYQNVTYFERSSIFLPALCIWQIVHLSNIKHDNVKK